MRLPRMTYFSRVTTVSIRPAVAAARNEESEPADSLSWDPRRREGPVDLRLVAVYGLTVMWMIHFQCTAPSTGVGKMSFGAQYTGHWELNAVSASNSVPSNAPW